MMLIYLVSGIIFAVTFGAILLEKLHRTIVAFVGASAMVTAGILIGFYSQEEALESIDFNTLGLLLGMMILVNMLARTGFFEYIATLTAKKSKGNPWYLLVILGSTTTVLSLFLDNVTTVVLIAPITILLAEILGINPIPLLMAEALLSNTGGVATLIGDPPNILIGSAAGLSFNDFLVHLLPIVFVSWMATLFVLRYLFRQEMDHHFIESEALDKLDESIIFRDQKSAIRVVGVLSVLVLLFFVHHYLHLKPAFIALLGASAALLLIQPDIEDVLRDIEWSVLFFFGALFVTVGGVEKSGLLHLLAEPIADLALYDTRLTGVAVIWVSALVSALVDNIPFTIAMIPIIQDLEAIGVNITPLWWALALGAGFGGNGTSIGSTANIIVVSISEKTHTPITARLWLKRGLPVMLLTCLIGTILYILTFQFM